MNDIPDMVNGIFEFAGAFAVWDHFRQVRKDKQVAGVSKWATIFFTTWGAWNLYYYAQLNQIWSWWGGLLLFIGNCFWVGGILYYKKYPGGQRLL